MTGAPGPDPDPDRHEGPADPDPLARLRDLAGDDPRVQAGVEHLQRAAHEAIAASRALLDVAEDLVDDPRALGGVLELLGGLGGVAARLGGPVRRGGGHPPQDPFGGDDDDDPPVQRIPVS